MKKFTYLLMAALFCGSFTAFAQDDEVKVTPAFNDDFEPNFKFDKNTKYYAIYLDDETKGKLAEDQVVYIGPDQDAGRNLFVWDKQSSFAESPSGNNSFDVPGAYMSYIVGGAGWSGIGYNVAATATPLDLSGINDDYKFHIALKATGNDAVDFYLTDGSGHEAHLVFGSTAFDNKEPIANFERDGEWYNIDIPMTYLEDNFGLSFKNDKEYKDKNILCLLAGDKAGFTIDYDAVFFYGPKNSSTGIKEIQTETKNGAAQYFTVDGKQVTAAQVKATKGLYLVKQNGKTKKVIL